MVIVPLLPLIILRLVLLRGYVVEELLLWQECLGKGGSTLARAALGVTALGRHLVSPPRPDFLQKGLEFPYMKVLAF